MKENNVTVNGSVTVNGGITINWNVNISNDATLRELLAVIGEKKEEDTKPTAKKLAETAGEPIAESDGCKAYGNGYAVYDNGSSRPVVLWLADCTSFTYHFNQLKDSEKDYLTDKSIIGEDVLGEQPWYLAVMVRGDHVIEGLSMNRKGDRKGNRVSLDHLDDEYEDGQNTERDKLERKISRKLGISDYGNPEQILIRKEEVRERLGRMTDKQRRVFLMYHVDGCTQQEIADELGISQPAVIKLLDKANAKIQRF